jgi:hypothetical protein
MKVELEKTFPMPATVDAAWGFLQNIEGVAGCMPGAKITERIDDTHYKGTISVRVGPAGMSFKGEIEVQGLFAGTRTLHLVGKGSDTSGTSGASMDLVARIDPGASEGTSNLVGKSEVTMSGKAAAFGGRMMGSVADQILKQFAGNFAAQVQARAAAAGVPAATAGDDRSAIVGSATTVVGGSPVMMGASAATAGDSGSEAARAPQFNSVGRTTTAPIGATNSALSQDAAITNAPHSTPAAPHPAPATELNALALFWAILRDWFRGLFRRKPA